MESPVNFYPAVEVPIHSQGFLTSEADLHEYPDVDPLYTVWPAATPELLPDSAHPAVGLMANLPQPDLSDFASHRGPTTPVKREQRASPMTPAATKPIAKTKPVVTREGPSQLEIAINELVVDQDTPANYNWDEWLNDQASRGGHDPYSNAWEIDWNWSRQNLRKKRYDDLLKRRKGLVQPSEQKPPLPAHRQRDILSYDFDADTLSENDES